MARSGGFEPPTAWFVARYSIQLSYERVLLFRLTLRLNCCVCFGVCPVDGAHITDNSLMRQAFISKSFKMILGDMPVNLASKALSVALEWIEALKKP